MDRLSLALASAIRRRPILLVAAAMCLAVALGFGIPRLKFRTGQDTLLDPGSKISRDNARFQAQFGGDPMLVLFSTPPDGPDIRQLFTPQNRAQMAAIKQELDAGGRYQSVLTPLVVVEFAQKEIEERMVSQPLKLAADEERAAAAARNASAARGESVAAQDAAAQAATQAVDDQFAADFGPDAKRFVAVGDHSLDNPKFVEFVLFGADGNLRPDLIGEFPDIHHALMVARLQGNLTLDQGSEVAGQLPAQMASHPLEGVSALVSGPPLLIKEINDKMKSALALMAGFAVVIMIVVLSVVFRARWRLLSLPAVLIGCISAFGLMGFAGIPLTIVTISGLPILIGLGVDFAIQIHSRIEEETLAEDSAELGLERTFVRLGPALALAAVAASIGFLVLHVSRVPMIRDFGSMLAVGAVIVFITSIVLISCVIYLRERQRLGSVPPNASRFEVERIVGGLTSRTVGRLVPIALAATFVAVLGLYVSRKIPTQTDPEKFVPADSTVLKDLRQLSAVVGSTSELDLLLETAPGRHVTDQDILDWLLAFEERERHDHPELMLSNSLASFTKSVTGDTPTSASAEAALASAPQALRDTVANADRTQAAITFAISDQTTLDQRKALTDAIERDAAPPDGVTIAPAGIAVVGSASVDAIAGNRDLMSLIAISAILVTLLLVYRNPVKAVAPLLPVVLALGASATLLYFAGIEYSPLTSISGPLIIAMGTEFNILLMARYFEERAAGAEPRDAMSKASLRIGRAIAASGITVMGGFAVLAFSNFPLLDNFGKVTAMNIGVSLLSTLILLPPLLVWADEDRHFVPVPATPITP
jgi:hydrophobe/amphiphile efflux-3 (HAE3) family protein